MIVMIIAMMLVDCVLLPCRLHFSNILMIKMIMINWNDDCYVYYVDEYCDDACWLCTPPTQIAIFQYFDDEDDNGEWRKW